MSIFTLEGGLPAGRDQDCPATAASPSLSSVPATAQSGTSTGGSAVSNYSGGQSRISSEGTRIQGEERTGHRPVSLSAQRREKRTREQRMRRTEGKCSCFPSRRRKNGWCLHGALGEGGSVGAGKRRKAPQGETGRGGRPGRRGRGTPLTFRPMPTGWGLHCHARGNGLKVTGRQESADGSGGRTGRSSSRKSGRAVPPRRCHSSTRATSRKPPRRAFPAVPAAGVDGRPHARCHHDTRAPWKPRLRCTVHVEEKAAGGTEPARSRAPGQPPGTCSSQSACPPAREARPAEGHEAARPGRPRTCPEEACKCLHLGGKGDPKTVSCDELYALTSLFSPNFTLLWPCHVFKEMIKCMMKQLST